MASAALLQCQVKQTAPPGMMCPTSWTVRAEFLSSVFTLITPWLSPPMDRMALAGRGAPRAPGLQRAHKKRSDSVRAITGQTERRQRGDTLLKSADAQNKSRSQSAVVFLNFQVFLSWTGQKKICFSFELLYPKSSEIILAWRPFFLTWSKKSMMLRRDVNV